MYSEAIPDTSIDEDQKAQQTKAEKKYRNASKFNTRKFPDFSEISLLNPEYKINLIEACNYAAYVYDTAELAKYPRDYLVGLDLDRKVISAISDHFLSIQGAFFWCLSNGAEFEKEKIQDEETRLLSLYERYKNTDTKQVQARSKPTEDEKILQEILCDLELCIDALMLEKDVARPKTIFTASDKRLKCLKKNSASIVKFIEPQFLQCTDPEFAEFYENTDSKFVKKLHFLLNLMTTDLQDVLANLPKEISKAPVVKSSKKPRKVKKKNPTKVVKSLKFLKEYPDFNLKSITPEKILESSFLWVYNIKTQRLGWYVAKQGTTLFIKGSSVLNYDEPKSVQKRLRSGHANVLAKLIASTKPQQKYFLQTINSKEKPLNGRISKDTILLKVY